MAIINWNTAQTGKVKPEDMTYVGDKSKSSEKTHGNDSAAVSAALQASLSGATSVASPVITAKAVDFFTSEPAPSGDVSEMLRGSSSAEIGDTVSFTTKAAAKPENISGESAELTDIDTRVSGTEDVGELQDLQGHTDNFNVDEAENIVHGQQAVDTQQGVVSDAAAKKTQGEKAAVQAGQQAETDKTAADAAGQKVEAQKGVVSKDETKVSESESRLAKAKEGVTAAQADLDKANAMPSSTPAETSAKEAAIAKAQAALIKAKAEEAAAQAELDKDKATLGKDKTQLAADETDKSAKDAAATASEAAKEKAEMNKLILTTAFTSAQSTLSNVTNSLAQARTSTSSQQQKTSQNIEEKLAELQEQAQNSQAQQYAASAVFGNNAVSTGDITGGAMTSNPFNTSGFGSMTNVKNKNFFLG